MPDLSLLLIEDDDARAARIDAAIAGLPGPPRLRRERSLDAGWLAIVSGRIDAVLLGLPGPTAAREAAFTLIGRVPAAIPVVAVADDDDHEDGGLDAVRAGAHECVQAASIDAGVLGHALAYAAERSRFRVALKDSERRLSEMIAAAMDGIIAVDDAGLIILFNPAAERMFGISAAAAIGTPLDRLIPAEHRGSHFHEMRRFAATGRSATPVGHQRGVSALRANGEVFPVEASISHAIVDGRSEYTVILRDVTARRRAEEALLQSEARLKAALEAGGVATWTFDLGTARLWVDDRFLEILGRTRQSLPQASHEVLQIVHPEDRERAWESLAFDRGDALNPTRSAELRALRADGRTVWLSMIGRLERQGGGMPARVVGTAVDITARRETDMARLRSQKLEALGTLAGGIAHDFNNILLAIMGNAGLAELELPPGHAARENLGEIGKAATRAAELVRRITAFSRPQDDEQRVMNLAAVVREAVGLLHASTPAQARLVLEVADDLPPVLANATEMHQVVVNLVTNAAHALGSRGGRIVIALDRVVLSPAEAAGISGLAEGTHVRLTVSDDGAGMDLGTLHRIFDPYFTTKPPGQGTGLGLAVVHAIVVAHRGAISVRSAPGEGATFTIHLPAATGAEESLPAQTDGVPRGRGEHILFVDDEPALVRLADRLLRRLGYRVTGCEDPGVAVELFRSRPAEFDLVVTDLAMPSLSGLDVAQAVRRIRPDVPIVMTSGYVRPEEREAALAAGVSEFMLKPATREVYGRTIHGVLNPAGRS